MAITLSFVVYALLVLSTEQNIDPLMNNLQLFWYVRHTLNGCNGLHSIKWMPMKDYWFIDLYIFKVWGCANDWLQWGSNSLSLPWRYQCTLLLKIHYWLNDIFIYYRLLKQYSVALFPDYIIRVFIVLMFQEGFESLYDKHIKGVVGKILRAVIWVSFARNSIAIRWLFASDRLCEDMFQVDCLPLYHPIQSKILDHSLAK